MRRRLTREAKGDIAEARRWYERQREGLGREFLDAVAATLDRIAGSPRQFPIAARDVRRAGVKRFPYGVFFHLEEGTAVVIAVMHDSRSPRRWRSRR